MKTLEDLLQGSYEPPCLSLYQPTHRSHPENAQDPIRFRNLVKQLEASLGARHPRDDAAALLAPFYALAADERFWNRSLESLAAFAARGVFRIYRLQRPVGERAIVADTFHVKPLLRMLQSAERFQVLALSRGGARLFEGDRDVLDEIELDPAVPRIVEEAIGDERKQAHSSVWTYRAGASGPGAGAGVHHGQGGEKDVEMERDTSKFFRALDRAILEQHSRPSGLPLVLAALAENQARFRAFSHNPFLLADGIDCDPQSLSADELRRRAWRVLEPHYLARLSGLVEMFGAARAKELGTDDLDELTESASAGRVATLLLEAEHEDAGTDERIDDLGEAALRNGGQVIVVPAARMPTRSGAAAIYRY